jgi:hypothetical protein
MYVGSLLFEHELNELNELNIRNYGFTFLFMADDVSLCGCTADSEPQKAKDD